MLKNRDNKIVLFLLILLVFAFLIRVIGINYGLPNFFIGDEQSLIFGSLKMAELKTLAPVFHPSEFRPLYYPPLMPYIYLFFLTPFVLIKYLFGSWESFEFFKNYLVLNPEFIWLIIRIINVLIGTATVYLIYLTGHKFFNKKVGLFSALFLSLSFFHIQLSHFARHWTPAVFFFCLVLWLSSYIYNYKNPRKKYYFLVGIAAGLAFGASYITAISLLPFLLIHFAVEEKSFTQKIKDKNLWLALIIFILISGIFIVLHPQEFIRIVFGEDSTLTQTKNLSGWLVSFVYYFKTLLFFEPIILFFSLLGGLVLWFRSKKEFFIFLCLPIVYITVLYLFFHHESRYIILVIPWLCLLAGYALYFFLNKIKNKLAITVIFLLIFIYPLIVAVKYDYLLSQKDTRILAKEWIEGNISKGDKIITDWEGIRLIANKKSILLQKNLDENSLRTDDKILLSLEDEKYPQSTFSVLRLQFIGHKLSDDLSQYARENNYQYFIVQYWQKNELSEQSKSVINQGQLIQRFNSGFDDYSLDINGNTLESIYNIFSMRRLGPIVEIYQL